MRYSNKVLIKLLLISCVDFSSSSKVLLFLSPNGPHNIMRTSLPHSHIWSTKRLSPWKHQVYHPPWHHPYHSKCYKCKVPQLHLHIIHSLKTTIFLLTWLSQIVVHTKKATLWGTLLPPHTFPRECRCACLKLS